MSLLHEVIGDIAGPLLTGMEDLDRLVSEAISKIGGGVEWTGDEVTQLGDLIAGLIPKMEQLRAKL